MKLISKILIGVIISSVLITTAFSLTPCDSDYSYARYLNITTTEAKTNAQILVNLNSTYMNFSDMLESGYDIRFYDTSCNNIKQFRQYFNKSLNNSYFWLNDTTIKGVNEYIIDYSYTSASDNSTDDIFYFYDSMSTKDVGKWTFEESGTSIISAINNTVTHYGRNTTYMHIIADDSEVYIQAKPSVELSDVTMSVWYNLLVDSKSHMGFYPENTTTWANDPSFYDSSGDSYIKEDGSANLVTGVTNNPNKWYRLAMKQNDTGLFFFKSGNTSLTNQQTNFDAGQTLEGIVIGEMNTGGNVAPFHLSDMIIAREPVVSSVLVSRVSTDFGVHILTPANNTVIYGNKYNFTFMVTSNVETVNLTMWINGTLNHTGNYTANTTHGLLIPFKTQGDYEFKIGYTNKSLNQSANVFINLFKLNSTTDLTSGAMETQNVNYFIYINNYSADFDIVTSVKINGTVWNATLYETGSTNITYLAQIQLPSISIASETISINTSVLFDFGSYTSNQTLNQTVPIYKIYINNCTGVTIGNETITFDARYELNNSLAGSIDWDVRVAYNISDVLFNFSYSWASADNISLCIYPPNQTIYADIDIFIEKDGFDNRIKIHRNLELSIVEQKSTLFLITSTNGTLINFLVNDQYSNEQEDILIKIQRYFFENTTWTDVTTIETNQLGRASAYLQLNDVQYRFLLYENGFIVNQYDPLFITSTEYTLTTASTTDIDYTSYMDIEVECNYNEVTKVFRCTGTNPSGANRDFMLTVTEVALYNEEIYCDTSASGSAVTLTCDLSTAPTDATQGFTYSFSVKVGTDWVSRWGGRIGIQPTTNTYGSTGVFITFLLVLVLGLIGVWNVSFSVILGLLALILSSMGDIIQLHTPTLIIMTIITLFIVTKLRS